MRDVLSGNSNTTIIANVIDQSDYYFETMNSLRFAAKAKTIKVSPKANYIAEGRKEDLKKQISILVARVEKLETIHGKELAGQDHLMAYTERIQRSWETISRKLEEGELVAQTILKEADESFFGFADELKRCPGSLQADEALTEKLKGLLDRVEGYLEGPGFATLPNCLERLNSYAQYFKEEKSAWEVALNKPRMTGGLTGQTANQPSDDKENVNTANLATPKKERASLDPLFQENARLNKELKVLQQKLRSSSVKEGSENSSGSEKTKRNSPNDTFELNESTNLLMTNEVSQSLHGIRSDLFILDGERLSSILPSTEFSAKKKLKSEAVDPENVIIEENDLELSESITDLQESKDMDFGQRVDFKKKLSYEIINMSKGNFKPLSSARLQSPKHDKPQLQIHLGYMEGPLSTNKASLSHQVEDLFNGVELRKKVIQLEKSLEESQSVINKLRAGVSPKGTLPPNVFNQDLHKRTVKKDHLGNNSNEKVQTKRKKKGTESFDSAEGREKGRLELVSSGRKSSFPALDKLAQNSPKIEWSNKNKYMFHSPSERVYSRKSSESKGRRPTSSKQEVSDEKARGTAKEAELLNEMLVYLRQIDKLQKENEILRGGEKESSRLKAYKLGLENRKLKEYIRLLMGRDSVLAQQVK